MRNHNDCILHSHHYSHSVNCIATKSAAAVVSAIAEYIRFIFGKYELCLGHCVRLEDQREGTGNVLDRGVHSLMVRISSVGEDMSRSCSSFCSGGGEEGVVADWGGGDAAGVPVLLSAARSSVPLSVSSEEDRLDDDAWRDSEGRNGDEGDECATLPG